MTIEPDPTPEPVWAAQSRSARWASDHVAADVGEIPIPGVSWEKRYPRFERYDLGEAPGSRGPAPHGRQSCRSFDAAREMTHDELCTVLAGVIMRDGRYPFASAGGLYATEFYLYAKRVADLPGAMVMHVLKSAGQLEQLWVVDELMESVFPTQTWAWPAAMMVIVSANMEPYVRKYGERGYRFALQEAGAVTHSLVDAAANAGLGSCILGGFRDAQMSRALEFGEGVDEQVAACVVLGHHAARPAQA